MNKLYVEWLLFYNKKNKFKVTYYYETKEIVNWLLITDPLFNWKLKEQMYVEMKTKCKIFKTTMKQK